MYNTLSTNNITSNAIINNNSQTQKQELNTNDLYTKYSLLLSTLTCSHNLTNSTLNPTYFNTTFNTNSLNSVNNNTKDLTLIINDLDLLNIDNLEVLTNFSNTLNHYDTNLSFFNVNSYNTTIDNTTLNFTSEKHSKRMNFAINNNLLKSDSKLLTDMYILTLITK